MSRLWTYYSEVAKGWCVIDNDDLHNGTPTQLAFFSRYESAMSFIEGVMNNE